MGLARVGAWGESVRWEREVGVEAAWGQRLTPNRAAPGREMPRRGQSCASLCPTNWPRISAPRLERIDECQQNRRWQFVCEIGCQSSALHSAQTQQSVRALAQFHSCCCLVGSYVFCCFWSRGFAWGCWIVFTTLAYGTELIIAFCECLAGCLENFDGLWARRRRRLRLRLSS